MTPFLVPAVLFALFASPVAALVAGGSRRAQVAGLGGDAMPFSLQATTHVFTKTADGGTQRVVIKSITDTNQVCLVREHLHAIHHRRAGPSLYG